MGPSWRKKPCGGSRAKERQPAEEGLIHQREDGRIGADSEGDGKQRDNGESPTTAAALLGMSRATIYRKIRQYDITLPLAH